MRITRCVVEDIQNLHAVTRLETEADRAGEAVFQACQLTGEDVRQRGRVLDEMIVAVASSGDGLHHVLVEVPADA